MPPPLKELPLVLDRSGLQIGCGVEDHDQVSKHCSTAQFHFVGFQPPPHVPAHVGRIDVLAAPETDGTPAPRFQFLSDLAHCLKVIKSLGSNLAAWIPQGKAALVCLYVLIEDEH